MNRLGLWGQLFALNSVHLYELQELCEHLNCQPLGDSLTSSVRAKCVSGQTTVHLVFRTVFVWLLCILNTVVIQPFF